MGEQDEKSQTPDHDMVQPHVMAHHLKAVWIGLGAAIEWIALRGHAMSVEQYYRRHDEAREALVDRLSDTPPDICKALVQGVREEKPGPLGPIPSGIWQQTATSEQNITDKPFYLLETDDEHEWEGAIRGVRLSGYRRVQMRTDFIRDNWPEHSTETKAQSKKSAVSMAEIRRVIEEIVALTPSSWTPLTQREMRALVKCRLPKAPRDSVDRFYLEIVPGRKRGPRGPHNPDRETQIQELIRKMLAGQLVN